MILCDTYMEDHHTVLALELELELYIIIIFVYSIIIIVRISYARLVANRIMNGRGDLHIMIKQIDTFCMMMMCMCD